MKRNHYIGVLLLCFLLCFGSVHQETNAAEPVIQASGALVMDMTTGQVLWQQSGYELLEPASTTKILTALLALDVGNLEQTYTVTPAAAAVGESSANLQVGETFTLENLLTGALVKSANDACFAIGEAIAGNEPLFVYWMNLKGAVIGAYDVSAKNTNGLPNEEHKLSCYDLALTARLAMQHDTFATLVSSSLATMEGGNYNRTFKNTNKLLQMNPDVIGIKTGTTDRAGACLVSAMERDGRTVIAAVLHSPDRYGESIALLNYGIDSFQTIHYAQPGEVMGYYPDEQSKEGGVMALAENQGVAAVPKEKAASLHLVYHWQEQKEEEIKPVQAGDVVGTAELVDAEGTVYGRMNLLAAEDLTYSKWQLFWQKIWG